MVHPHLSLPSVWGYFSRFGSGYWVIWFGIEFLRVLGRVYFGDDTKMGTKPKAFIETIFWVYFSAAVLHITVNQVWIRVLV